MGFYVKDELVLQRLNLNPVYVKVNGVASFGVWVQAHLCFIIWLGAYNAFLKIVCTSVINLFLKNFVIQP